LLRIRIAGLIFRDGVVWREQRRFTLRHLRDFGYARRAMEGVVHEEMRTALATVERDRQCDLAAVCTLCSANVILQVMTSKRHDPDDVEFRKIMEYNHSFFRNSDPLSVVVLYPLLQVLPFGNSQYKNQLAAIKPIQKYIEVYGLHSILTVGVNIRFSFEISEWVRKNSTISM
jgi:methyl farnesoate epoxidase/farnesoate epoxidase